MKTLAEQFDEFKMEQLVHQELLSLLTDTVGLDFAVAIEIAYHIEQKFKVGLKND